MKYKMVPCTPTRYKLIEGTAYTLLLCSFINQPSCTYIGLIETNQHLNTRKDKTKTPSLKEVWTVAEYKGVSWIIWSSFW
jgi:hypothetical protein